jgi:hypothetical protein
MPDECNALDPVTEGFKLELLHNKFQNKLNIADKPHIQVFFCDESEAPASPFVADFRP